MTKRVTNAEMEAVAMECQNALHNADIWFNIVPYHAYGGYAYCLQAPGTTGKREFTGRGTKRETIDALYRETQCLVFSEHNRKWYATKAAEESPRMLPVHHCGAQAESYGAYFDWADGSLNDNIVALLKRLNLEFQYNGPGCLEAYCPETDSFLPIRMVPTNWDAFGRAPIPEDAQRYMLYWYDETRGYPNSNY